MSDRTCGVAGCSSRHEAKGFCNKHYLRLRKYGDPEAGASHIRVAKGASFADRFWVKVDRSGECWLWLGSTGNRGYGQFRSGGRIRPAHRVAYELLVEDIPEAAVLDHLCFNHACVNPMHLRPIKAVENSEHREGAQTNSKSGVRGVSWSKRRSCWVVWAKHIYGGGYATLAEAEDAAIRLRLKVMTHSGDELPEWHSDAAPDAAMRGPSAGQD